VSARGNRENAKRNVRQKKNKKRAFKNGVSLNIIESYLILGRYPNTKGYE